MTVNKGQRPFSGRLFVLAVSFIVMLILMAFLTQRLNREIETVERVQFQMRLAELQSAVLLVYASLVAKDKTGLATRYIGMNPMTLMTPALSQRIRVSTGENIDQEPVLWPTYMGEVSMAKVKEEGVWVFDPEYNVMAYRPKSKAWLKVTTGEVPDWLQFQVVGLWSEEGPVKELKGLELKAMHAVSWNSH